jgi:RNA polymerase sigma factor (sigma-70 family)
MPDTPPQPDDLADLRRFALEGSQEAFSALVRRRIDLVYSAALRQVSGDRTMAEDITQTAFIVLARKASSLITRGVVLSAWLLHTTRLCALDALRRARRRHKHEQRAAQMATDHLHQRERNAAADAETWDEIRPLLDEALAALGETDRRAIALRYFEDRPLRDVAIVLGVSEEAARQRVWRAVERLRGSLGAKGAAVTAAGLGAALSTQAVHAAPAALAATVSKSALAAAAAAKASIPIGLKGALHLMAWTKAQIAGTAAVAALLLAGATATVVYVNRPPREQKVVLLPSATATSAIDLAVAAAVADIPRGDIQLEGVIHTPGDQAAVGAEVFIAMPDDPAEVTRQRQLQARMMAGERIPAAEQRRQQKDTSVAIYADKWPVGTQTADASGHFSFNGLKEPWILVARHASGYVQVPAAEFKKNPGQIILQPWGKVEGRLLVGDQPQVGQKIHLFRSGTADDWEAMHVRHDRTATTDAGGRFSFDRVAPGDSWLTWEPKGRQPRSLRHTLAEVEPGKTLEIDIGGRGRPVIGYVATVPSNAPDEKITWSNARGQSASASYHNTLGTQFSMPKDWEKMPREDQIRWQKEWEKSPAGKERLRHQWSEDFDIKPDGSFRIDDLVPGKYQAQFRILHTENGFGEDLVHSWIDFVVPQLPDGKQWIADPLDVGAIPVNLKLRATVGKPAPDFHATTIDGKPLKLSDYKGKYVVLKWWWSWSELDTEVPAIKKANERIKADPNWALITIGFDKDPSITKQRVAGHDIPGIHARLANEKDFEPYLGSPSTLCIIGPDGQVLARNLHAVSVDQEITKIMLAAEKR